MATSGKLLDEHTRQAIIRRRNAGDALRKLARQFGLSRNTVRKYVRQ